MNYIVSELEPAVFNEVDDSIPSLSSGRDHSDRCSQAGRAVQSAGYVQNHGDAEILSVYGLPSDR